MEDIKWTDIISHIEIEPRPKLTKNQKKKIRKQNAMLNGLTIFTTSKDLQDAILSLKMTIC
jgi:hypothetical protein